MLPSAKPGLYSAKPALVTHRFLRETGGRGL